MSIASQLRNRKRKNPQCREGHAPQPDKGLVPFKPIGLIPPRPVKTTGAFGGVTAERREQLLEDRLAAKRARVA